MTRWHPASVKPIAKAAKLTYSFAGFRVALWDSKLEEWKDPYTFETLEDEFEPLYWSSLPFPPVI